MLPRLSGSSGSRFRQRPSLLLGGAPIVALAALVAVGVAGVAAAAPARQRPVVRLTITVYRHGFDRPASHRYTLQCGPRRGTVPRPRRACRRLLGLSHPFAPVPPHSICSQIALGPQAARVVGHVRKQRVRARLTLAGSCQIDRWRRLSAVVPGFPSGHRPRRP